MKRCQLLPDLDTSVVKTFIDNDRTNNPDSKINSNDDKSTTHQTAEGGAVASTSGHVESPPGLNRIENINPSSNCIPPSITNSQVAQQSEIPIVSSGDSNIPSQNNITVPSNLNNTNVMQQLSSLITHLNLVNPSSSTTSSAPATHLPVSVPLISQPQPYVQNEIIPNLQNSPINVNQLSMLLSQLNNSLVAPQSNPIIGTSPILNSVPVASSPHSIHPEAVDFESRPSSLGRDINPRLNYNIHKWNLSFDGSKTGLNVDRFLYRVETNASVYNIQSYRLMNDIQYLLKGKALNWFWSFKENKRPTSWSELRNAMTSHFKDERNDFDIRQSICERKQKLNESFQDFYTAITEMTLGLSEPLRDFDLMLILHGNMRLGLKEKLAGKKFNTSTDLFDECVHIENTWRQISYVPEKTMGVLPNPRSVHEIREDLSQFENSCVYQPTNDSQFSDVSAVTFSQNNSNKINLTRNPIPQHILDKVQCWNCKMFGHFYYNCPQGVLLHVFCRGCGQSDILFEYCVKCQGNIKREVRVGVPTSQKSSPQISNTEDAASNTDPELYQIIQRNRQK